MATTEPGATKGATKTTRTRTRTAARKGTTKGKAGADATKDGGHPPAVETLANNANRPFDAEATDTDEGGSYDGRTIGSIRAERDRLDEILRAVEDAPKPSEGANFHHWIPPTGAANS